MKIIEIFCYILLAPFCCLFLIIPLAWFFLCFALSYHVLFIRHELIAGILLGSASLAQFAGIVMFGVSAAKNQGGYR